jgi:hypothetical protein
MGRVMPSQCTPIKSRTPSCRPHGCNDARQTGREDFPALSATLFIAVMGTLNSRLQEVQVPTDWDGSKPFEHSKSALFHS